MNLLLVNYEYPPLGGGAGNATASLAAALHRQGHRVHVVTSGYRQLVGWREEQGVSVLRLRSWRRHVDRASLLEMLGYVLLASCVVPGLIRKLDTDGCVVFFSLPCGPIGWIANRMTGRPYIIALRGGDVPGAERGVDFLQRILAPIRRAILRRARAVVANSQGLAAMSVKADPIPVDVIANGVDTDYFRPRAQDQRLRDAPVRVLFAGRFQPQKNLPVLLAQFAKARASTSVSLQLALIGDGRLRASLELQARQLGIEDAVTWHGWLNKPAMAQAYRQADVFVNPSLYEGMPNTVLEAMASGLPVIASDVPGNDELVDDGRTGLLFPLGDADQLSSKLVRLAEDDRLRMDCGRAGRGRVVAGYSWDTVALRYAAYFSRGNN